METGYFHPDLGYWETVGSSGRLEQYPDGTAVVPLRPSPNHQWLDGEWQAVPVEVSTNPRDYPLKRWQFKAMVDYLTETEVIASGAIDAAIDQIPDAMERARVRARCRDSDRYDFADPLFAQLAPAVGLTMEQLADAWMLAKG